MYKTNNHNVKIIGYAPEETYIDCIGGQGDINEPAVNVSMIEIPDL